MMPMSQAAEYPRAVVVLDDDPDIAQVLRLKLERDGFIVVVTHCMAGFESATRETQPAAVIIDLNLGSHDGLQATELLSSQRFGGPVFLISGTDERVIAAARRHGEALGPRIGGTFRKPFSLKALSETLKSCAGAPAAPDAGVISAAIQSGEIRPYFQPQVDLVTGHVAGAEALARWLRPDGKVEAPSVFMPFIESANLWRPLTERMLVDTARSIRRWHDARRVPCRVSVNLESAVGADPDFGLTAAGILDAHSVPHDLIGFEITEQTAMSDIPTALRALTWLRIKGFELSLDDFGTGFSSLSVLHSMPFSELKIDRSFVQRMARDRDARLIVKATIDLAHNLELICVAEGIEDDETRALLLDMGCDRGQGYLFGKPVDADAFSELLPPQSEEKSCQSSTAAN